MGCHQDRNHFYFGYKRENKENSLWQLHYDILKLLKNYQYKYDIIFKDYPKGNSNLWKTVLKDIDGTQISYVSNQKKVNDLLKISGGLYFGENSSAAFDKAVFIRHNQHDNGFSPIQIDINSIINGDENANFELKPFDRLSIPKKMDSKESYTALIVGEVAYPGRYPILSSSENLSSFINKTGGLLPTAFKIERDTLQVGWLDENVVINHNDRIVVPKKPGLVQVLGSVNNPGYFSWEKGKSVRHYIKLAGGISSRGDKKTVYVKYANSRGAPASGLFNNPPVHEGASIFVSEKEIYKNEITYLDVLQTFASTVGSFATFLLLLRSL